MSQFKHLLVAIDYSEPSIKALETGLDLAEKLGARLTVVHTVMKIAEGVSMEGGAGYDVRLHEQQLQEARAAIEQLLREKNRRGIATEIVVESGRAQDEINRVAARTGADMLILGTHGRKGMNRFILGSVAEEVLRESLLPILCVRT
jgi:nucleotide-binding universal stress UspA family protein